MYLANATTGQTEAIKSVNGALPASLSTLLAGELQQFNRLAIFAGGISYLITATGVVLTGAAGLYRLRCLTSGTIQLADSVSAATPNLVGTVAMTAGQVIELGDLTAFGVYATVTSGTYRLIAAPSVA